MAFGFVVARFGILLDELPGRHHLLSYHVSTVIGTALVLVGAIFLIAATIEFVRVKNAIESGTVWIRTGLYIVLASVLVVVSLSLAVYLLITG